MFDKLESTCKREFAPEHVAGTEQDSGGECTPVHARFDRPVRYDRRCKEYFPIPKPATTTSM